MSATGIRGPNLEQKSSIEHKGGVLLSAGAGSGKTFVLVEHIIFLINQEIQKILESARVGESEVIVKEFLSKIVVMTFTNKAAGEIKIRLISRISHEINSSDETEKKNLWSQFSDHLGYLNLGTIHGYCLKVLKSGLIADSKTNLNLLNDAEIKKFIENAIENFLDYGEDKFPKEAVSLFRLNLSSIQSAYHRIFSDPELRLIWDKRLNDPEDFFNIDEVCFEILTTLNFDFFKIPRIEEIKGLGNEKKSKPKWFEFFLNYESLLKEIEDKGTFEQFEKLNTFFSSISRYPTFPKDLNQESRSYFKELKKIKDFLKSEFSSISLFNENFDFIQETWAKINMEAYRFVKKSYSLLDGITFSDMEYDFSTALEDSDTVFLLNKSFTYFIVDEFQDTSKVQFEIISKVIQEDFTKLFGIGDLKQAIYGFRGGEVNVFKNCSDLVPSNLSLKNNYRSDGNIIRFNNEFFDYVFSTKNDYSVLGEHPFDPGPQSFPAEKPQGDKEKGKVEVLSLSKEQKEKILEIKEGKLDSTDLNKLEALLIVQDVLNKIKIDEKFEACILYKKLAPSTYLLKELLDRDLDFIFQVKVSLGNDPIIIMFIKLLERLSLGVNDSDIGRQEESFFVKEICGYLQIEPEKINEKINNFYRRQGLFGKIDAFVLFLTEIGISSTYYQENILLLEQLYRACFYDDEELLQSLKDNEKNDYSIEFIKGSKANKLRVMTVHGSKGLEFPNVYLGGLWTNGRKQFQKPMFGKIPYSFKWKLDSQSKELLSSPHLILEDLIGKNKDFQEDKRLLYVANTRAKENLILFDYDLSDNEYRLNGKAWWNAFKYFLNSQKGKKLSFIETRKIFLSDGSFSKILNSSPVNRPFFHSNSTGYSSRLGETSEYFAVGEMSVTNFSEIALCPRKFYLKNILKLSEDDMEILELDSNDSNPSNSQQIFDSFNSKGRAITSSAERGTEIHEQISRMIKRNFVKPLSVLNTDEEEIYDWVKEEILAINPLDLISEEDIKFSVFGHMFNGKPDLIIRTMKGFEVWDFKTGRLKDQAPQYELQLLMYAYSLYERSLVSFNDEIKISLIYVDEKTSKSSIVTWNSVKERIFSFWRKLNSYDQVNRDHCSSCLFGNLCRFPEEISHL